MIKKAGLIYAICIFVSINLLAQNNQKDSVETIDGQQVLWVVEEMPKFKGGNADLLKYIGENIDYPPLNKEEMQSTIYISFVIDTIGKVRRAKIMRPMFKDRLTNLEQYCIGFFENMPTWEPGKQNGKKVPVRLLYPLRIHLSY